MNYKQRLDSDDVFKQAYEKAGLPKDKHKHLGMRRQYAKWLKRKGVAWKEYRNA